MTISDPQADPTEIKEPTVGTDGEVHRLTGAEATQAVRRAFSSPIASLVVTLIALLWAIPLVGFFINSFRGKAAVADSGWWTWFAHPTQSTLSNYHQVLSGEGGLVLPLVNSLAITIPATIIPIMLATMAAYALAWIPFRGSNFVFFSLFALQVVPLQMALVPLQNFYKSGVQIAGITVIPKLGVSGLTEIWLSHTMFSMPLAVFLIHNFVAQLPGSLIEAARVDGASHLRIFRSIVLPLSTPAIASFGIFQFLWVWNDLLVAKTFGGSDVSGQPVTARIQNLAGNFGAHQELLAPAGFLAIVIPLIVFLSLQRFFVRGLLAGSVKG
jgi:alpha-glucoside transport system permease protein